MGQIRYLNPDVDSKRAKILRDGLKEIIVEQDEAIDALVNITEKYHAKINAPNQPLGSVMFLGPTGTGKTRIFEAYCGMLFGNERACVKIDCGEFQHSGEIAKLIGSPPGYLGHRETPARLSQKLLDQYHNDDYKLTVLLFDEIEKASDALWHIMLGILDKAILTLGSNETVDFSKCIIGMTSNAGSDVIAQSYGNFMGFNKNVGKAIDNKDVGKVAIEEAKRKFTVEFINRIDKIVSFNVLSENSCRAIIEIELNRLQIDIFKQVNFFSFKLTEDAKKYILEHGYDSKYNARNIRRIIDKELKIPLARLIASGQIQEADDLIIDVDNDKFSFGLLPDKNIINIKPEVPATVNTYAKETEKEIEKLEELEDIDIPWLEEKKRKLKEEKERERAFKMAHN